MPDNMGIGTAFGRGQDYIPNRPPGDAIPY